MESGIVATIDCYMGINHRSSTAKTVLQQVGPQRRDSCCILTPEETKKKDRPGLRRRITGPLAVSCTIESVGVAVGLCRYAIMRCRVLNNMSTCHVIRIRLGTFDASTLLRYCSTKRQAAQSFESFESFESSVHVVFMNGV